jgi:hypothetical protein
MGRNGTHYGVTRVCGAFIAAKSSYGFLERVKFQPIKGVTHVVVG